MFGYVNFARRCIRSVDAYASTRSHSFPFVSRRLGGFWLFGRSWCRWLVSGSPCPRGARSPWLGRALVWLVVAGSRSVSVGSLAGSWFLGCSVPWFSLRRVEMNASPSCPIVLNGSDGGLVGFARRSCGVVPWGPCRVLLSGSLVPVCLPSVSLRRPRACPPFVSCLGSLPGPAFRGLGFLVSAFRFPGPALFLLVSLPCFRRSFSSSSFPRLASLLAFVAVTRFRAPFLAMCSESPPLSAYGCVPHLDFRVAGDSWLGVPVPDAIFHQSCVCFFSALREVSFLAFEVLPSRIV